MNDEAKPALYRVTYSGRVRDKLGKLFIRARGLGREHEVKAASETIDRRLQVYPQFGEPLIDLNLKPLTIWIACVPPLTVRYVLDEERREVTVAVPLRTLPNSGL